MGKIGTIGILMFIIALIGIAINLGIFKTAKIVGVRPFYAESICPEDIYSFFDISLKNVGEKDTSVCLIAWSDEINMTNKPTCFLLEYGENSQSIFRVDIDPTSLPSYKESANVTINYEYSYNTGIFNQEINKTGSCKYEKKDYSNQLKLID